MSGRHPCMLVNSGNILPLAGLGLYVTRLATPPRPSRPAAVAICVHNPTGAPSKELVSGIFSVERYISCPGPWRRAWIRAALLLLPCFNRLLITLPPTGILQQICRLRQESLIAIQPKWTEPRCRRHSLWQSRFGCQSCQGTQWNAR